MTEIVAGGKAFRGVAGTPGVGIGSPGGGGATYKAIQLSRQE